MWEVMGVTGSFGEIIGGFRVVIGAGRLPGVR